MKIIINSFLKRKIQQVHWFSKMTISNFLGIKIQLTETKQTLKIVQKISHNIHNFQLLNNNPNSLSAAQND